jgi:hypothetical protein
VGAVYRAHYLYPVPVGTGLSLLLGVQ